MPAWLRSSWSTASETKRHDHSSYRPGDIAAVLAIPRQLCEAPGHHIWTEDISILQIFESDAIITHVQVTDVYLLGLAVHKSGKLASLDQRIPVAAVRGGREALELIIP